MLLLNLSFTTRFISIEEFAHSFEEAMSLTSVPNLGTSKNCVRDKTSALDPESLALRMQARKSIQKLVEVRTVFFTCDSSSMIFQYICVCVRACMSFQILKLLAKRRDFIDFVDFSLFFMHVFQNDPHD